MAGRPRKPAALKKLSGTDQPCRMVPEANFGVITKIPAPPKYMNKYAKKLYKTTAQKLAALRLLNEVNLPVVVGYANEMGKYWEAEEQLKEKGRILYYTDKQGNEIVQRNPLDKMASEYLMNAKSYAQELGITPATASRVKVPEPEKKNPFSDF